VERSQSRQGEWTYVNVFTKARQSDLPSKVALPAAQATGGTRDGATGGNSGGGMDEMTEDPVGLLSAGLPEGWKAIPSQSRPGQVSYVNLYTKGKQQTRPESPAPQANSPPLTPLNSLSLTLGPRVPHRRLIHAI